MSSSQNIKFIRLRVNENGRAQSKLIVVGTTDKWDSVRDKLCHLVYGPKNDSCQAKVYLYPDGEEVTDVSLLQDNDKICVSLDGSAFKKRVSYPSFTDKTGPPFDASSTSSGKSNPKPLNLPRHLRRDVDDMFRKSSMRNLGQDRFADRHSHAHVHLDRAASFATGLGPRLPGMRRGWDSKKESNTLVGGSRAARVRAQATANSVLRTNSEAGMRGASDTPSHPLLPRRRSSHQHVTLELSPSGLGGAISSSNALIGGQGSSTGGPGAGVRHPKYAGRFLKRTMSELNETDAKITSVMVPAGYATSEGLGPDPNIDVGMPCISSGREVRHGLMNNLQVAAHGASTGQLVLPSKRRPMEAEGGAGVLEGGQKSSSMRSAQNAMNARSASSLASSTETEQSGNSGSAGDASSNRTKHHKMKRKGSIILDAIGGVAVNAAKERFLKGINKLRKKKSEQRKKQMTSTESIESYIAQICNIYSYNELRSNQNDFLKDKKPWGEYLRTLVFLPDTSYRLTWDVLIMLLSLYYVMIVPVRVGWAFQYRLDPWEVGTDYLFDVLFWVDIFINFRTAYNERGRTVTDVKKVFNHYLYGYFWMDLIASLPFDVIEKLDEGRDRGGAFRANKILRAFRLFKIFRVVRLERYFQKLESFGVIRINPGVIRFSKAVMMMLGIWHYVGCFYWMISVIEYNELVDFIRCDQQRFHPCCLRRPGAEMCFRRECLWYTGCEDRVNPDFSGFNVTEWMASLQASSPNATLKSLESPSAYDYLPITTEDSGFSNFNYWLPHPDLADRSMIFQYGHSFFWAVEVTTGVGDDICPHTQLEILYTVVSAIIGIFLYAIIIGSASAALQNMDHASNARKEMIDKVRDVLRYRNVPGFFQKIILDYYVHLFDNPTNEDVLQDLPMTLRLRLSLVLNRDLIDTIPIFRQLCADSFIRIVQRLQNATYLPGEYIGRDGEYGNEMFFIKNGQVDMLYQGSNKIIITMKEGCYFGETCLLRNEPRKHSIRAVDYVDVLVLERLDFEEIFEESTEFYDVLMEEAESRQTEIDNAIVEKLKYERIKARRAPYNIRHRSSLLTAIHAIAESAAAVSPVKNIVAPDTLSRNKMARVGSKLRIVESVSDRKKRAEASAGMEGSGLGRAERGAVGNGRKAVTESKRGRGLRGSKGASLEARAVESKGSSTAGKKGEGVIEDEDDDEGKKRRRSLEKLDAVLRAEATRAIQRRAGPNLLNLKGGKGRAGVDGPRRLSVDRQMNSDSMRRRSVEKIISKRNSIDSLRSSKRFEFEESARMAERATEDATERDRHRDRSRETKRSHSPLGGEKMVGVNSRRTSMEEIDKLLIQGEKDRWKREAARRNSVDSVSSVDHPDIDLDGLRL